ncbi:hypothetical protein QBC40DRAFT_249278 [Triangularia verruculosa]|uniref:Uncharacterized protein n=1 Tax=Triangularia verruculosa TaxID=2587418 RepID=A0AAN6XX21_9PEZI|nr:hypothetical protein QBC40DRAFT_249278 [Triangularia verruculosa]
MASFPYWKKLPTENQRLRQIWESNSVKSTTLTDALEEIAFLKSKLGETMDFVQQLNKSIDAPSELRPLFLSRWGYVKTRLPNPPEAAWIMAQFLRPIEEISEIEEEDALESAYSAMLELICFGADMFATYHYDYFRKYEEQMDAMLVDIIGKREKSGHVWEWDEDLMRMESSDSEINMLRDKLGAPMAPWFPRSQKALKDISYANASRIGED